VGFSVGLSLVSLILVAVGLFIVFDAPDVPLEIVWAVVSNVLTIVDLASARV
jgi:hypothetical protein